METPTSIDEGETKSVKEWFQKQGYVVEDHEMEDLPDRTGEERTEAHRLMVKWTKYEHFKRCLKRECEIIERVSCNETRRHQLQKTQ